MPNKSQNSPDSPLHDRALEQTLPSSQFTAEAIRSEQIETIVSPPDDSTIPNSQLKEIDHEESSSVIDGFNDTADLPRELQTDDTPELPRFSVIEQIGKGATSRVFAVHDNGLGRTVAVKFLKGQGTLQEQARKQFLHEAHVTANLEHPNIIPIHDIGLTNDRRVYFTMKHVRGITVGDAIRALKENRVIPEEFKTVEERLRIVLKVCDGLALAHNHGYVHQDIKPDNIMLGRYGEVLLLDWGCALSASKKSGDPHSCMYGTPAYMAPEQARKERADIRSDIYSLAATLYHMLLLCHPTRESDPERFWEMKRSGTLSPLPQSIPTIPAPLIAILHKALAPDPAQRYQSVREFHKTLLEYMDHAESLAAASAALGRLDLASQSRDLAAISRISLLLDQALEMWPENALAKTGLAKTRESYVQSALELKEYRLVVSYCADKPQFAQYAARAQKALAASFQQARRARLQSMMLVAFAVVVLGLLAYFGVDYYRQFGQWQKVYHHDFVHTPALDSTMLFFNFNQNNVPGDTLFTKNGLRLSAAQSIWFTAVKEFGDIRVELELQWPDNVDGFEIALNADVGTHDDWAVCPAGYSCQFGGYRGTTSFISRNPQPQRPTVANGVPYQLDPHRYYRLTFQRTGDLLSLKVDNRQILTQPEPLPVKANRDGFVYIRSWANADIRSITVWRLNLPQKASPVVAGDALLKRGYTGDALSEYIRIASAHQSGKVGDLALLKAGLLAATMTSAEIPDTLRESLNAQAAKRFHSDGLYLHILEAQSQRWWRSGEPGKALDLAAYILERNPDSRVAMGLLGAGKHQLEQSQADKLLKLVALTRRVNRLDLSNLGIGNLEPLRGARLDNLILDNNRIQDLSPLAGMPLTNLSFPRNNVSSLDALKGMPLVRLNAGLNRISSLEPLRGTPLIYLGVSDNNLSSLEGIEGMPLVFLDCNHNTVRSLEPLAGLLRLSELQIQSNMIADLSPLSGLPLKKVDISSNFVESLSPLRNSPLIELRCANTPIRDLAPLADAPLIRLDVGRCPVQCIEAVSHPPLRELVIVGTKVSDLSPLAGLLSLRELDCSETAITSLEPLRGLRLNNLSAAFTKVTTLAPLEGQPLTRVAILDCPIASLLPLQHSPITALMCENCPLTSLAPYETVAPKLFTFYSPVLAPAYVREIIDSWKAAGYTGVAKTAKVIHAVKQADREQLRLLADTLDGHRYTWVHLYVPFGYADSCARALGGHLVTIESAGEDQFVTILANEDVGFWIGIDSTTRAWNTGAQLTYRNFHSTYHESKPGPWYKLGGRSLVGWLSEPVPNYRMRFIIEWDS